MTTHRRTGDQRSLLQSGITLLLITLLLASNQLLAEGHVLRVTLRDSAGQNLAGITLIVRDEQGRELRRQMTDAGGTVSFTSLPSVVRIGVEGQIRRGPRLYQLGDDALGVRLDLGEAEGAPFLDLRVERDGLVLPDPATMLALEDGGPTAVDAVPLPTALIATPAPLPTFPAPASTGVVSVSEPRGEEPHEGWVPLVTALLVTVAAGVMLVIRRRGEAP
jgi:hypothetical protein